ncbi:MAG TPA: hypothetical protein VII01_04065, partial [Solirubrobacteraceae bacterium]
ALERSLCEQIASALRHSIALPILLDQSSFDQTSQRCEHALVEATAKVRAGQTKRSRKTI